MDKKYDFINGEILIIDKPLEWTSFDVVHKIRNALKRKLEIKKIKVGHAGTLDPLATGVLVVCTGKMTKQIDLFVNETKSYDGIIQLGSTTPSFDLETEIDQVFPAKQHTAKEIELMAKTFLGEQLQVPPLFSAKRINGTRAYVLARKGEDVKLAAKLITIHEIFLELKNNQQLAFKVCCSKGTYVRSIARDIGEKLGVGGHLIKLRRTKSGNFDLANSISVEECVKIIES
jgi:tRNA pseudouridine55 synthase